MFDPATFLNQSVAGPMSTSVPQCPEGEFRMVIASDDDISKWFREVKFNDKQTGAERSVPVARIPFLVQDDNVKKQLAREKVIVPMDIWLDVTSDGKLDTSEGKNVKLGALREALGQNTDADWNFAKLRGAGPVLGRVGQRADKNNPETKYSEVTKVTAI